jgi:3-hydroxyisobutyrate dehydrogenase-like beta-hydroxyacid dehydrogenase
MGHGMARNVVEKGFPLTVTAHRNRAPIEDLVKRGAVEAASARAVAERSSIVLLCVTGSREVEAVIRGKDGLKAGLKPGSVIIDCSTADPTSTVVLAEELAAAGIDYADAPLSRTPKEAWEGKLDTMVGASDAVFARIRPVLETWAGKIVHIGGVGDGHRMKLLNNFVSLGYAAIYAEALALANKVGISSERFDSVIRGGRMDNGFYQTFMGYTIEGNREAHKFTIANAFKDLTYLESMADSVKLANPVGNVVKNAFAQAFNAGGDGPENYVPHLPEYVGRANGIDLTPKKLRT